MTRTEPEEERMEVTEQTEARLQPEGRHAEATLPEKAGRQVGLGLLQSCDLQLQDTFALKRLERPLSCLR